MNINVSTLESGVHLDWLVGEIAKTNGVLPACCVKCRFFSELSEFSRERSEYYCDHPNGDLRWDSDSDSLAPAFGVHENCPIDEYMPEPYSTKWDLSEGIITQLLESGFIFKKSDSSDEFIMEKKTADINIIGSGKTPLVAAMKSYVMENMGDNAIIPDEVIG